MIFRYSWLAAVAAALLVCCPAHANFHVMQIEQVIGGVNGDATSQAIQLRMRQSGQNVVSQASLWAADAAGANRVLLLNIGTSVSNSAAGADILLTTSNFTQYMVNNGAATFAPDFTLTNAIPASYLNAGRLTFEADGGSVATPGTIYWSLSWGGTGYTGSNTSTTTLNDPDGNFGPAFASALPTATRTGVLFPGAASALSTTNAADYALSDNPTSVTKNLGTNFVIPPIPGDFNGDGLVTASDYGSWKSTYGNAVALGLGADGNRDGTVNAADYTVWRNHLPVAGMGQASGDPSTWGEVTAVPEPAALELLLTAIVLLRRRRRTVASRAATSRAI